MTDAFLLEYGPSLVRWAFFGAVSVMLLWEAAAPRRPERSWTACRWLNNGAVGIFNLALARTLLPVLSVSGAILVAQYQWGLWHRIAVPYWAAAIVSVLLLDLTNYWIHRLFHVVPVLWRTHRVHHADLDYDFTTALRFHPLEDALASPLLFAVIAALGIPVGAVVIREVLTVAHGIVSHANIRLAERWDRLIRLVVVTPDMHRVHHSARRVETDSNFSGLFPVWDRLFGTYRPEPGGGHIAMEIGLSQFRDPRYLRLHWILALPFMSGSGRRV